MGENILLPWGNGIEKNTGEGVQTTIKLFPNVICVDTLGGDKENIDSQVKTVFNEVLKINSFVKRNQTPPP